MPTWPDVLAYVNNAATTRAQLDAVAGALGIVPAGLSDAQLRDRLRRRIAARIGAVAAVPAAFGAMGIPVGPGAAPAGGPAPAGAGAPPAGGGVGPAVAPGGAAPAGLTITTASPLPQATVGTFYNKVLTANGGTLPYNWVGNGLPAWLTLDNATGLLHGTPLATGNAAFNVQVVDNAGNATHKAFQMTVNPATAPAAGAPAHTTAGWGWIGLPIGIALGALLLLLGWVLINSLDKCPTESGIQLGSCTTTQVGSANPTPTPSVGNNGSSDSQATGSKSGTTSSSQSASSSTQAKAAPTSNPSQVGSSSDTTGMVVSTPEATGFRTPYTGPATSQPDAIQAIRQHIGLNVWSGAQLDLSGLKDLGTNEWYLAHGDVAGNGSCGVWVWKTGKPRGLSHATWQLYLITGPSEGALTDMVAVEQQIAGNDGKVNCPSSYR